MKQRKRKTRNSERYERRQKRRGLDDRYHLVVVCYDRRTRAEWLFTRALIRLYDQVRKRPKRSSEDVLRDIFFQRRRVVTRELTKRGVDYHAELGIPKGTAGGRGHTIALAYAEPDYFKGRRANPELNNRIHGLVERYDAGQ